MLDLHTKDDEPYNYYSMRMNLRFLSKFPIVKLIIFSILSLSLTYCGGSKDKTTPESTTSITLSINSLDINATNGSGSIVVNCGSNWSASASSSEVKVSPSSGGKGSTNVTITLPDNTSTSKRSYTVTFKSGSNSKILTISQAAKGTSYAEITLDKTELTIKKEEGSTGSFNITCSGDWKLAIANAPEWVNTITPNEGSGNATITITTKASTIRTDQSYILSISSGNYNKSIVIIKQAAENHAPTKPSNLSPTGSNVSRTPQFSWSASSDSDNDQIQYTVQYSKNNSNWTSLTPTTSTNINCPTSLDANSTYYWKVVADDGYPNGKVESNVVSFTTNNTKTSYDDCEVAVYQQATVSKPVVLIFTGDGYTQEMYNYGGQFDTEVNAQIEALFEIEPYKSFRHYFTVYKIAAYSNEAGVSIGSAYDDRTTVVDTRFKCTWEGDNSTGIDCDIYEVIDVVENIPGIKGTNDDETLYNLTWSPISITINANVYAGTNIWWGIDPDKQGAKNFGILSVAQTPARHPANNAYEGSANTLRHEFGGHGFGLLEDEYVYYTTRTIPADYISDIKDWKNYGLIGCNGNVTFETELQDGKYVAKPSCEWYQFIGREEYTAAAIGVYEGAFMYGKGIWRSEYISCMDDNRPHFNTQSRWQIYRRIKISAGENPTLEDFIAHDNDKVQNFANMNTKGSHIPLAPPTLITPNKRKIKRY